MLLQNQMEVHTCDMYSIACCCISLV